MVLTVELVRYVEVVLKRKIFSDFEQLESYTALEHCVIVATEYF